MGVFVFLRESMERNIRKWTSLLIAILCYYLIHEGSHLIFALMYGAFEKIKIIFPGIQIVCNTDKMSNYQIAMFCLSGSFFSMTSGHILMLLGKSVKKIDNKYILAISYYTTLVLLMSDPVYLSVLSSFVGGGDLNGIVLFGISEINVKIIYGIIGCINLLLIVKIVYPCYKKYFIL